MKVTQKHFILLTTLFVFIIYLLTLAPSVVQIDAGELAAVQSTLGIAHPTGYPIFTLVGYLFSLIPSPFRIIYQLNMLAAIWCTLSVMIYMFTLQRIDANNVQNIQNKAIKKFKKKISKQITDTSFETISEDLKTIAMIFSGLFLAFGKTFWMQSTSVEVYSLHVFFLSLIISITLKAYRSQFENRFFTLKNPWLQLSIVLAFGFANHMTTLLILPGIAYLYFTKFGFNVSSFKKLFFMIVSFIFLLILFYLYLPLRASQQPVINWGNPIDFEKILRHISGKQYQVWIFSSLDASKKQFIYFIKNFPVEYTLILIPALVGLFESLKRLKKISVFFLISFASTILYSINYDISDIDSYFLLAYISTAYFSFWGIIKIFRMFKSDLYRLKFTSGSAAVILIFHFWLTYSHVDQSGNYIYEDYSKELINSVPKGSIILSYQWDYFISASYYFQNVEDFRKDVTIVDKELLRRSWYYNQLKRSHPFLLKGVANQVKLFNDALVPFELDEPFNSNLLEQLYQQIIIGLITTNLDKHDIFIAPELVDVEMQRGELKLPAGYYLVPDLFMYRIVKENKYYPAADPKFKIRMPKNKDKYVLNIQSFVASMLSRRALFELQNNKLDRAKVYAEKIVSDFPDYGLPPGLADILK